MNINEKTLSTWLKANGQGKPSKESLQFARSLACEPEFLGSNNWQTPSTSKPDTSYKQQVYFAGMNKEKMLGLDLNIECNCPSIKSCKHIIAIERKYHANWKFYFHLFGLPTDARLSELHHRAEAVAVRMEVEAANESCGCFFDWDSKFTNLCDRHEAAQAEAEHWERYEAQFGWAA